MEGQENIAKDRKRRKKTLGYIFGALALVLIVGVSYAFLSVIKPEKKDFKTALSTGTMILTFDDNNPTISGSIGFGDSITKKFKIINDGSLASSLSIDWNDLKNTYTNGSLVYKLNRTDENGALQETVLEETNIPTSSVPIKQALISEVSVPSETTYYYDLVITLKDLPDVPQDADLNAMFSTGFDVGIESSYRYYTLTVEPNGGTWETFTAPQEYQLQHNETKTGISDPTRVGYDFNGWEIKGTSSTLNAETLTMGISDTYLVAKWTPKKVAVTVNIDENITTQEEDYEGTITLEEPTKEGHTFEGWTAVGGEVDGNTIRITNLDGVTVTPVWKPIDYQYIVYHNKMTTNGTYAPVDINTDKESGTKPFGTEYPLPLNQYDGFITPQQKTLLITSNEENNKWTYEYERMQPQLTIDPNGGVGGTESQKVYFEKSITLEAPTRVGYNFTRWNETSSTNTLTDNTVKMGTEDVTVQAEWTPKTIPIVLNANGGIFNNDPSITTKSTTVTYDSTYGNGCLGNLPTPTRDGYKFAGWYTENSATGGTEVTDSTTVAIETEQILYARWREISANGVLALLQENGTRYTSTSPVFGTPSITNDGLFSMADDYTAITGKSSYYFRGAVPDNYVKFGGFYWRIIRINGDGSLRMIYDGKQAYANGTSNDLRNAVSAVRWSVKDYDLYDDAKYVGYMYGPANETEGVTTHSTSAKEAQTNVVDSNAKAQVDNWYKINMLTNEANENKDLTPYLADSIFCNDRTMPAEGESWWGYQDSTHANLGWSTHVTPYGAFSRFLTSNENWSDIPSPTFVCPTNKTLSEENDKFTVEISSGGNGNLTYPVGLITADEIVAAGSGKGLTENISYYLYKGGNYFSWSLSPVRFGYGYANMYHLSNFGALYGADVNLLDSAIAPVINLKPEYAVSLKGSGTMIDPYTLPGVQ